jgi:hypothetical protein
VEKFPSANVKLAFKQGAKPQRIGHWVPRIKPTSMDSRRVGSASKGKRGQHETLEIGKHFVGHRDYRPRRAIGSGC